MSAQYEWDAETIEGVGDDAEVVDHYHGELADVLRFTPAAQFTKDVALVRDDEHGRSWAYVADGKLPTHFENAHGDAVAKVPQRFHAELARAAK